MPWNASEHRKKWEDLHAEVRAATGREIVFLHALGWWWKIEGEKLGPANGPFGSPREAGEACIEHFAEVTA